VLGQAAVVHEPNELQARIDELAARAVAGEDDPALVRRIEDVLAQGYAEALQLDAQRRRLDRQMDELAESLTDMETLRCLRRLALQARTLDGHARELRARLSVLRERFVALGGTQLAG
jgi:hypothetical protein